MKDEIRIYLSEIGRRGGKKSRRRLEPETAKRMVVLREARRAFRRFYSLCFWSYDPDYVVELSDVDWVVRELRKNGNRPAWEAAARLCH